MKSAGILYVDVIKYPMKKLFPLVERGWSSEIEEPFRRGVCLVFRVPFTKRGFAFGIWRERQNETDALLSAMAGKWMTIDDLDISDV